ncbi:Putative peptidoglycan binding domain-containing protein [Devosia enhydra]|uniref:Putative peptidoglycan binding domain-containing protein n=1 Tax=Devosia enhydra TaxID=665118 RepID=A0A1K2I0I0_9HYPH|nr:peptidoglycan-binding domain-containing protein [Devosia enhydra]SFZ85893.1 Putative peptidoglycan binding domain-containing protein [Devosia enhydra]
MTATTLTHLPLAAGGAIAHSAKRAALWGIASYMRAPLANTAITALVSFSVLAGSNALYLQKGEHPAPLFGVNREAPAPVAPPAETAPAVPVLRETARVPAMATPQRETTGSVAAPRTAPEGAIGNKDVFEVQRKLQAMGLFTDRVDGFYGPKTASAIRAFEQRQGLTPRGELSREIVQKILATSIASPAPAAVQRATPEPVAAPQQASVPRAEPLPLVAPAVAPVSGPVNAVNALIAPPPAPSAQIPAATTPAAVPLAATVTPLTLGGAAAMAAQQPRDGLRRELPATPQQAMDIAVETAGDAIETIIQGVQSVAMTSPPAQAQPAPAPAQIAAIQPMPALPQPMPTAPTPTPPAPVTAAALPQAVQASTAATTTASIGAAAFSPHDREVVARIQRGLASLGFLHGPADGVAGEATARAIRNFEVYYNYDVTGRVAPELVDLLLDKGAVL